MLKHLSKLNKPPERDLEPDERATPPERASLDEDIIILSDLHLGEACKDIPRIDYLKAGDIFDRHISSFLQYKTGQAASGRPMRLILGGDLLDFLQVTIAPADAAESARTYGLGNTQDESTWKLLKLAERHRAVFVHLADFVGVGHRVDIIQGNHDVEFFWPKVRAAFLDILESIYFGDELAATDERQPFRERIQFHSWFLYIPGRIYIEHGHRFDEFCNTPPQLHPVRPGDESSIVQPLSAIAIQYFANLEKGFATHDKEHWGLIDYIRYFRGGGFGRALELLKRYITLASESVRYHQKFGRRDIDKLEAIHRDRLKELSAACHLDEETLQTLDKLGPPSIMRRFPDVAANVCLGEVAALGAAVLAFPMGLACGLEGLASASLSCCIAIFGSLGAFLHRRRYDRNIRAKLRRAALRIHDVLDVPIVAFGHSHSPTKERLPDDHRKFYVNTGSFLKAHHGAHESGAPCTCHHTFVEIPSPGAYQPPVPVLKNWCAVESKETQYTAS